MERDKFEELVAQVLDGLPAQFRERLTYLAIKKNCAASNAAPGTYPGHK